MSHFSEVRDPLVVSQNAIADMNWSSHSYPYTLALGDQTGTYWYDVCHSLPRCFSNLSFRYHSHLASQYVDGIRGAIVICTLHSAPKLSSELI